MAKTQWTSDNNETTPFNALKEYDRLMGEKCREAQAWRLRAIITMAANVILLAIAGISVTQNKTVPVFISENELGELSYMGTYTKNYGAGQITQRMVYAQLNSFVTNMYTIPQDAEVLRNNMRFCYAALTSQSAAKFTRFQKEDNPFDNFGMKTSGCPWRASWNSVSPAIRWTSSWRSPWPTAEPGETFASGRCLPPSCWNQARTTST